jgi:YD repeat-containing protein
VKDNIGRTVLYTYDGSGNLATVTDPENHVTSYTYDSSHQMLTVKPPHLQGTPTNLVTNEYTTAADAPTPIGWVKKQTYADGGIYPLAYTFTNGKVSQTDVTNPRGYVRRVTFNGDGYSLSDSQALGQPEEQVTNSVRQGDAARQLERERAW